MKSAPRIDEEMAGAPVEAHGYIVTPFARVRGMTGSLTGERSQASNQGSGRYGWAVIQPVRMTVQTLHLQDRSGEIREVKLVDVEGQAVRALAMVAGVVFLVTLLISLVGKRPVR